MTTEEKTAAIKNIIANHQDNVTAANAAEVHPGLTSYVLEAMNNALKSDLEKVFAVPTSGASFRRQTTRASAARRRAKSAAG